MTTPYVLLADDDRAIRLVAQKALEKAGFRVHSVDRISSLMEVIVCLLYTSPSPRDPT